MDDNRKRDKKDEVDCDEMELARTDFHARKRLRRKCRNDVNPDDFYLVCFTVYIPVILLILLAVFAKIVLTFFI